MSDITTITVTNVEGETLNPVTATITVLGTVPAGPPGAPGDAGASAYEVAVAEGFVGDEAAWLASLVGEQGEQGEPGDPGTPGADGEGVPTGGTTGQVLSKASDDDYDTEWVEQTGGGGSGVVETVVAGAGVSVDSTDPANPVVTAQVTQAELDAEASTRGAADTALDGRLDTLEAISIATDAELAAEAALARNADNLLSGTVDAARIPSTIARDTEVQGLIDAAINALLDGAPGALDTLNELAAAVNDDASFAASVTTALAGKQPLDADLTAIAALTTTTIGRSLLAAVDDAALRTILGLGTAATAAATAFVSTTGAETIAGAKTFSSDVVVPDEVYDATAWNGNLEVPTKNAVRDKIQTVGEFLIEEQERGSTGTFDFTGIPATFRHLRLVIHGRGSDAATAIAVDVRFNNDSSATYAFQRMRANLVTQSNGANVAQTSTSIGTMPASTAPAGSAGALTADIPNYRGTTFHKAGVGHSVHRRGTASSDMFFDSFGFVWESTAAINRITTIQTFLAGSVASLYGVT